MTTLHTEPDPFDIVFDLGEGKEKKKIEIFNPELESTNAIKEELINFSDAINNNETPVVSILDGYNALSVANQIMDKLEASSNLITEIMK